MGISAKGQTFTVQAELSVDWMPRRWKTERTNLVVRANYEFIPTHPEGKR